MIPICEVGEKKFRDRDELMNHLNNRQTRSIGTPIKKIHIADNNVRIGQEKFGISETGMESWLRLLRMPSPYAFNVCDEGLFKTSINTLTERSIKDVMVTVRDNTITGIHQENFAPIDDKLVAKAAYDFIEKPTEIAMDKDFMRITFLNDQIKDQEITKGDIVKFGYEILNSADVSGKLEVNFYVFWLSCTNGAVSKDIMELFKYSPTDKGEPLLDIMKRFKDKISRCEDVNSYVEALRLGGSEKINNNIDVVKNTLKSEFGEIAYGLDYRDLTIGNNWNDIIATMTDSAKSFPLQERRRNQLRAGRIISSLKEGGRNINRLLDVKKCKECPINISLN